MTTERPLRPIAIFLAIAVGTTTAIAILTASIGWTVHSPGWAVVAPIAMWAPALGRFVAQRFDPGFASPITLRRWGTTGPQVVFWPLAVPLLVYGAAYAVASSLGLAQWSPGGGRWTATQQIVANVVANLVILMSVGTLTAMGEELGWRGYLQPRLDAAGVGWSVAVVSLCQLAYHAPLVAGAGYLNAGAVVTSLTLFAAGDLSIAFIWAHEAYRARSLWPAVLFHSVHNTVSQWLFPHFFAGGDDERWLGEGGLLPVAGYIVLGIALLIWMRRREGSWRALAQRALTTSSTERQLAIERVR